MGTAEAIDILNKLLVTGVIILLYYYAPITYKRIKKIEEEQSIIKEKLLDCHDKLMKIYQENSEKK